MLVDDDNPFPSGWVHDPQPGRLLTPQKPCRSRVRVDLSNKHEIMRIERTITTKHDKYRQCAVEKPMSLPASGPALSSCDHSLCQVSTCLFVLKFQVLCGQSKLLLSHLLLQVLNGSLPSCNLCHGLKGFKWGPLKTGDPTLTWSLSAQDSDCLDIFVLH